MMIRKDEIFQRQMEEEFGVKMTKDDQTFYQDNCFGSYKYICTNSVPKDWEKMKKRKLYREQSLDRKRLKVIEEMAEQQEINQKEITDSFAMTSDVEDDDVSVQEPRYRKSLFFRQKHAVCVYYTGT